MRRSVLPLTPVVVLLCLPCGPALAAGGADLTWADSFPSGDVHWWIHAATVYDEDGPAGDPPVLFAAGDFDWAGGLPVNRIARWNGRRWSEVGFGLDGPVHALAVFDADGPGAARPVLVVGGEFTSAGGSPARNVAAWDGSGWSALEEGVGGGGASVRALHVWTSGGPGFQGTVLVVGGKFDEAGSVAAGGLAVWNGESWAALGSGSGSTVRAIADFQADLWVGGDFDSLDGAPISRLARYDGQSWSAGGTVLPADGEILAFATWIPGVALGSERLAIGGDFDSIDGVACPNVTSFDGTSFLALGTGIGGGPQRVEVLTAYDPDGSDETLWAGGAFEVGPLHNLARFDGTSWGSVGELRASSIDWVRALTPFDADGGGPEDRRLWIGGLFYRTAARVITSCACTWDGERLLPLGNGLLWGSWSYGGRGASFDPDGAGPGPPLLYVCNRLDWAGEVETVEDVAVWTGTEWIDPGFAANGPIRNLETLDLGSGPELYVIGWFTEIGGIPAHNIAKWDGTTWSALGGGINTGVVDLEVWDRDGAGPLPAVLVAAGVDLDFAGGVAVDKIAQWDGNVWSDLGGGAISWYGASALAVFDEDGAGPSPPALFTTKDMNTVPCNWDSWLLRLVDGLPWSSVGAGYGVSIPELETFDPDDDGPEPEQLYLPVGFSCFAVENPPAQALARWDGTSFEDLGFPHGAEPGPLETADLDGDGPGLPALFTCNVTGPNQVSRYDGFSWGVIGAATQPSPTFLGPYSDLIAHDPDGDGPRPPVLVALGTFAAMREFPGGGLVSSGGIGIYGDLSDPATSAPDVSPGHPPPAALLTAGRATPTPAPGRVRVEFSLAREGVVEAAVHDVQGRLVKRLLADRVPAGRHAVTWDGRTVEGHVAASGVYFLSLAAHGESLTRRIVRLR